MAKNILTGLFIASGFPVTIILFLLIWIESDIDAAWAAFEKIIEAAFPE